MAKEMASDWPDMWPVSMFESKFAYGPFGSSRSNRFGTLSNLKGIQLNIGRQISVERQGCIISTGCKSPFVTSFLQCLSGSTGARMWFQSEGR